MSSDILPPPPPLISRSPLPRGHSRSVSQSETPLTLTPQMAPATPMTTAPLTPLLIYSHGQTQVDTFTPNSETIQRALYTWSQVADYSTVYCERLPMHNGAILEPLCPLETRSQCPGHPWIDYSYHCKVKEWTQDRRSYLIQQEQIRQQQEQQQRLAANATPPPLQMPVPPTTYTHGHPDRAPMQSPLFMPTNQPTTAADSSQPHTLILNPQAESMQLTSTLPLARLVCPQTIPPHMSDAQSTAHASALPQSNNVDQSQTHNSTSHADVKTEQPFTRRHVNPHSNNTDFTDNNDDHHMME